MRVKYIDVLKGVAIIAVLLYHLGVCKFGYLGVDVFLVISGYFMIASVEKRALYGKVGVYKNFIIERILRLYPLLLIAGFTTLLYGCFFMLPDDLENLSQSVFATNIFCNNFLQCITTRNYWDVVNEYKPLMHTWYVGLIMQFYIIVPFFCVPIIKNFTNHRRWLFYLNILVFLTSIVMYLFFGNTAEKFYYLPYRLFEFCTGSIVYYLTLNVNGQNKSLIAQIPLFLAYTILFALLFVNFDIVDSTFRLIITVLTTSLLLWLLKFCKISSNRIFSNKLIATIGVGSFSIYVWHQIILAVTRYSFTNEIIKWVPISIVLMLISLLSYLSYKYIETINLNRSKILCFLIIMMISSGMSLYIYQHAGVIRDVPELNVKVGSEQRGMWGKYCDRGYVYNKNFVSQGKPKWLVIGNSFARDWINIILESTIADLIELSYADNIKEIDNYLDRFIEADVVFLSTLGLNQELVEFVQGKCTQNSKFFIVGEKNFGECNGQIYRKRFSDNYLDIRVNMEHGYLERNKEIQRLYPNNFINLISLVCDDDGKVKVFSDTGYFISQDCRHLTQAGAQYYAKIIDWSIF